MEKVEFKEGQLVTAGYVEIDGVKHTVVEAEYEGETPLSPFLLNKIQENAEKELITAKTTEYAEELIIKDSAPVNGVINIKGGKSVQKTTKGNQLVDFNKTYSMGSDGTYKFENDVLTYKSAGTSAYSGAIFKVLDQIKNNPGKILNFCYESFDISNFNSSSSVIVQLSVNVSGTKEYVTMLTKDGTKRNYTIPNDTSNIIDADLVILTQGSTATTESTVSITKPMLQFGTDKLEYEQYTGGVASPNINYRQEVESVGDNINLFDKDNANNVNLYVSSANKILSGSSYASIYIPIQSNEDYTVSKTKSKGSDWSISTCSEIPVTDAIVTSRAYNNTNQPLTIKSGINDKYLLVYYAYGASSLEKQQILDTLKIEKGTKATGNSPYGQGSISIKTNSANLVDFSNASISNANYTFENDILTVTSQTDKTYNYISYDITELVKNNIGKILAFDYENLDVSNFKSTSGVIIQIAIKKSDTMQYHQLLNKNGNEYTYTIPNDITDAIKVALQVYTNNSGTYYDSTVIIYKPMLQFGTDKLQYAKHQSQSITVPMQKPFRAIGDMKDRFIKQNGVWYEEHNIKELILNGTENWQLTVTANGFTSFNWINGEIKPKTSMVISNMLKYKADIWNSTEEDDVVKIRNNLDGISIMIKGITTLDDLKEKLSELYNAGTPLYIDYPLATPELIECTEEQKEALYQLEHAQMYENLTYITCTDEIKPEIKATYLYNNDLNKYYGTRLDAIESRLHILEKG